MHEDGISDCILTARRSSRSISHFCKLMTNVTELIVSKHRLLIAIYSVLLYGSEIWANPLTRCRKSIEERSPPHISCRIGGTHNCGGTPIGELARERKIDYEGKVVSRRIAAKQLEHSPYTNYKNSGEKRREESWRWDLSVTSQNGWTETNGEVNYYLAQFFTAYGNFNANRVNMSKSSKVLCQ